MVLNFAHRGSLTEAPENTVSAMKKAIAHDIQGIELDVQLTKDDRLVLIHEHHVRRFNQSIKGTVRDYTLTELKQIDIGSSFSEKFAHERLATLEEVLEIIPKDIVLNIEIKNAPVIYENIETILLACLHQYERMENIIISSFDHQKLVNIQQKEPNIPIGLLLKQRILKPWQYIQNSGLNVYSIHPDKIHVDQEYIANCHHAGYKVYPYTVNDIATYEQFVSWGIDGVFSNNPAIFSKK